MHAAGLGGGNDHDHPGGHRVQQVHGGRHDQAGGDWGPDWGCRQLECGEQHRGGNTKLNLKPFLVFIVLLCSLSLSLFPLCLFSLFR